MNIKIKAKGMTCPSCEMIIMDELEEQEGVKKALADHTTGVVTVDFDESVIDEDTIKDIIKNEGYEVD